MKNHGLVLVNKKTADLFVGFRVCFLDAIPEDYKVEGKGYSFCLAGHDGWIVQNPAFGPYALFFNRECENFFEILGDL